MQWKLYERMQWQLHEKLQKKISVCYSTSLMYKRLPRVGRGWPKLAKVGKTFIEYKESCVNFSRRMRWLLYKKLEKKIWFCCARSGRGWQGFGRQLATASGFPMEQLPLFPWNGLRFSHGTAYVFAWNGLRFSNRFTGPLAILRNNPARVVRGSSSGNHNKYSSSNTPYGSVV